MYIHVCVYLTRHDLIPDSLKWIEYLLKLLYYVYMDRCLYVKFSLYINMTTKKIVRACYL